MIIHFIPLFGIIGTATAALLAAGAGAATSLYGANKQSHDLRAANAANQAAVDKTNMIEWNNYLAQRGVNAGGNVAPGQIPTSFTPVNSRLPLWANMNMPAVPAGTQSNVPLFVKKPTG